MEKNLSEFIKNYERAFAWNGAEINLTAFFKAAEKFKREWFKENRHCAVCDKKLSEANAAPVLDYNFNADLCTEHAEYGMVFQMSIVRHKLGFSETPYADPIRNIPDFYE